MAAASFESYLEPKSGTDLAKRSRNNSTIQFFSDKVVGEHFCAVLKLKDVKVNADERLVRNVCN